MRRVEKMGKPGITLESVKNNNKSEILKMLQKNGSMSRKDIAASLLKKVKSRKKNVQEEEKCWLISIMILSLLYL